MIATWYAGLDISASMRILKCVLKYATDADAVFHALSDPTRRHIVEHLDRGPASVSQLAAPLPMSLPAVVQHLQVLEACGLVASEKVGRVRTCRLVVKKLDTVQDWIDARRATWERRLDSLGDYLAEQAMNDKKEQS
jgi:DNA-binding transcriptional ArsR family regulator